MDYCTDRKPHPTHPRSRNHPHPGFVNLSGTVFGFLTAKHFAGSQNGGGKRNYPIWACECVCGRLVGVWSACLKEGNVRSCGCKRGALTSQKNTPNLVGHKFGRLTVIERSSAIGVRVKWACVCSCGGVAQVATDALRSGHTKSCGCYNRDIISEVHSTHGLSQTSEYKVWKGMRQRCLNPNNPAHHRYGGRGINICPRWLESFENFLSDMGYRPSCEHSIDRINNDGPYSPDNCRWATRKDQANNRRPAATQNAHGRDGRYLPSNQSETELT